MAVLDLSSDSVIREDGSVNAPDIDCAALVPVSFSLLRYLINTSAADCPSSKIKSVSFSLSLSTSIPLISSSVRVPSLSVVLSLSTIV